MPQTTERLRSATQGAVVQSESGGGVRQGRSAAVASQVASLHRSTAEDDATFFSEVASKHGSSSIDRLKSSKLYAVLARTGGQTPGVPTMNPAASSSGGTPAVAVPLLAHDIDAGSCSASPTLFQVPSSSSSPRKEATSLGNDSFGDDEGTQSAFASPNLLDSACCRVPSVSGGKISDSAEGSCTPPRTRPSAFHAVSSQKSAPADALSGSAKLSEGAADDELSISLSLSADEEWTGQSATTAAGAEVATPFVTAAPDATPRPGTTQGVQATASTTTSAVAPSSLSTDAPPPLSSAAPVLSTVLVAPKPVPLASALTPTDVVARPGVIEATAVGLPERPLSLGPLEGVMGAEELNRVYTESPSMGRVSVSLLDAYDQHLFSRLYARSPPPHMSSATSRKRDHAGGGSMDPRKLHKATVSHEHSAGKSGDEMSDDLLDHDELSAGSMYLTSAANSLCPSDVHAPSPVSPMATDVLASLNSAADEQLSSRRAQAPSEHAYPATHSQSTGSAAASSTAPPSSSPRASHSGPSRHTTLRDLASSLSSALVARQSVATAMRVWIGVDSLPNHPGVRLSVALKPPTNDAAYILTALQEEMQVRALDLIDVRHVEIEEGSSPWLPPLSQAATPLARGHYRTRPLGQANLQLTRTVPQIRIPAGSPYSTLSPQDAHAHAARVAAYERARESTDSTFPYASVRRT